MSASPSTLGPVDSAARAEDERRTWAMVSHLTYFAHFLFPFGGLIAAIVLYSMRRRDVPYVLDNARNALNAEIVFSTVSTFLFAAVFASLFVGAWEMPATGSRGPAFPGPMLPYFVAWGVFAMWLLFGLVMSSIGARRAYLGGVFRYFYAIPFVR